MQQDAAQAQSKTPQGDANDGMDTTVKQDAAQTQNLTPHTEPHHGFGTSEVLRLFDHLNTWKAFVCVLALCLIGVFLIYRYEQPENSMPESPTTAYTSQSNATAAEDGEGRRAETQSEENDTRPDATDQERQDSSTDLRGTEPMAQQEVEDPANEAAPQAQERVGEAAEQAQDATGQATDQAQGTVEQASEVAQEATLATAEQPQEAAAEADEQAQGLGDSTPQSGVVEDEEPDAGRAPKQKAEQLGVDISAVAGSVQAAA